MGVGGEQGGRIRMGALFRWYAHEVEQGGENITMAGGVAGVKVLRLGGKHEKWHTRVR